MAQTKQSIIEELQERLQQSEETVERLRQYMMNDAIKRRQLESTIQSWASKAAIAECRQKIAERERDELWRSPAAGLQSKIDRQRLEINRLQKRLNDAEKKGGG